MLPMVQVALNMLGTPYSPNMALGTNNVDASNSVRLWGIKYLRDKRQELILPTQNQQAPFPKSTVSNYITDAGRFGVTTPLQLIM